MPRPLEHEHDDLGHVVGGHHPRQHLGGAAAPVVEREVGRDASRAHVRAADPVLAELVIERPGESHLPELGGAVSRLERQPAPPRFRRQRDHVPLAPEHVRQRRADRVERALEVHVDHLVEELERELEKRPVRPHSRVRDDDVDPAEVRGHLVAESLQPGGVANVARGRERAFETEIVPSSRNEPDVHPSRVEHARHGGADAAARARDHGCFPFQAHSPSTARRLSRPPEPGAARARIRGTIGPVLEASPLRPDKLT